MRTSLLILFFSTFACSQTPTLNPSAPAAAIGQSITITSSTNVTWSLAGSGTLSNQTPTSVTYTAPASVVSQSTMLGCPVLPNDSVFNVRIDNLPVDPNSATWTAHMSALGINFSPAWGITYADSSTPLVNVTPYYGDDLGNNPTYPTPFPSRATVKRENGSFTSGTETGNDHHVVIVQRSSCTFYETYNDLVGLSVPEFSTYEVCRYTAGSCNASSEIPPYTSTSFSIPSTTTDAAGLPLAPLTWTLADIKAGPRHAVRFTASIGYIGNFEWPAIQSNAGITGAPPYGGRFRLKTQANGGPNVTTVCTSATVLNQDCVNMLTALQQYGMILADIGGNNQLEISSDAVSDTTTRAAIALIASANIGATSFDAVNESSLQQTLANGYQLPSAASYAIDPANPYQTPVTYARLTATPTSGGSAQKLSIALRGIGIGLNSTSMAIAAGMSGYQIPSWVTGTTNQTVTWTLTSGVGSVTSAGVYTPPATTSGGTTAVLTATAAPDPNVHATLYVNVLTNNSGTYSIDLGSSTSTASPGKIWNPDSGVEASIPVFYPTDYPNWASAGTNIPEYLQYQSLIYTYGGDIRYTAVLPNGNYKIRWMMGQEWYSCPCNGVRSTFPQSFTNVPSFFAVNGNIVQHFYDWNYAAGFQLATPTDLYVPAKVTNNLLTIGEYAIAPDSTITAASGLAPLYAGTNPHLISQQFGPKGSQASGIEIIPDSSAPHWVIETQQVTQITPGGALQLYVTDWYTGDADASAPVWSIVSGPPAAAISSSGLLTLAASGTSLNGLAIVVKASGASHSATATIYTTGLAKWAVNPGPIFSHYAYTRTLTINHTKVVGALTNFPVTVAISDPSFATTANGGHVQNAKGYDIIVTSDAAGAVQVPWEVEKYDPVIGSWIAHVQVPSISNTADTTLYVFYSNPAILTPQSTGSVWDANFTAVYHLTSLTADSTANNNTASPQSAYTTQIAGGKIAGAANFASIVADISTPAAVLNGSKGTISAWVYSTGAAGNTPYEFAAESDSNWRFDFFNQSSPVSVGWIAGSTDRRLQLSSGISLNAWHHLVYTWDMTVPVQRAYIDGLLVGSDTATAFTPAPTAALLLNGPLNYNSVGNLDEVRLSKIARTASWVQTEYADTNSPATFAVLGAETAH